MGTPPLPRCAVQTGCVHRGGRLLIRISGASPPVERTSSPEEAALSTGQGGLCAKRQSFRVSCGRRERSCATECAPQWDGRFSSYFVTNKTICPTYACTTPVLLLLTRYYRVPYLLESCEGYDSNANKHITIYDQRCARPDRIRKDRGGKASSKLQPMS